MSQSLVKVASSTILGAKQCTGLLFGRIDSVDFIIGVPDREENSYQQRAFR